MKNAVFIDHLSVTREKTGILHDISLSVDQGLVVGLLGPSGAGKTTLMQAIMGLVRPASGHVTVLGETAGSKALRPQIGYVTQSPSVYLDLTVRENLRYFGAIAGTSTAREDRVARDVHLNEHAGQLVASLSGGQRARVSLAVALLGHPRLLVLDEPTVGLDPVLRQELWQQFHDLADGGVTLIISSHVMDEASRCDSLILLRDGRLLATGSPAELTRGTRTRNIEDAFLKLVETTK